MIFSKKLLYIFFLLLFYQNVVFSEAIKSPKLRIGVIAPLSGAIANWGKSVRAAIESVVWFVGL